MSTSTAAAAEETATTTTVTKEADQTPSSSPTTTEQPHDQQEQQEKTSSSTPKDKVSEEEQKKKQAAAAATAAATATTSSSIISGLTALESRFGCLGAHETKDFVRSLPPEELDSIFSTLASSVKITAASANGHDNDNVSTDQAITLLSQIMRNNNDQSHAEKLLSCRPLMDAVVNQMSWYKPALSVIGDLVTQGDHVETTCLASYPGIISNLQRALTESHSDGFLKEAAWTASNLFAGNENTLHQLISAGLHSTVFAVARQDPSPLVLKELVWAIANFASVAGNNDEFYRAIVPVGGHGSVRDSGLAVLCNTLMEGNDPKIVRLCLESIETLLSAPVVSSDPAEFKQILEDLGAFDAIKTISESSSERMETVMSAVTIIQSLEGGDGGGGYGAEGWRVMQHEDQNAHQQQGVYDFGGWNYGGSVPPGGAAVPQQQTAPTAEEIQRQVDEDAPDAGDDE